MVEVLEPLNRANRNLGRLLDLLEADPSVRRGIAPDDLAVILTELLRVGEWLHGGSIPKNNPEVARALAQYRASLDRLRSLMPFLHTQLLTERARLETERSHLEAASAWAGTSRQTT